MKLSVLLGVFLLTPFLAGASEQVFVKVKNGTIRGYTARAPNNNTIYSFLKIPFAAPPIGDLRFKNPEPTKGWGSEILDGTQLTPGCPQFPAAVVQASEDCLYLNVYSSRRGNESGREPAPVIVFMYGGAFVLGESSYYTGHRLLQNDVVLVVPNYRVGVFGFLSTGDEASPGNYGLKDQNLALRWVQENIGAFGGDPSRVTIYGVSAGAASVIYHLLSPLSHGLFHGVIASSGSAICPWAFDDAPLTSTQRLARNVSCLSEDTSEMVGCLRKLSTLALSSHYFMLLFEEVAGMNMRLHGTTPSIEPDLPGAFLTQSPRELLEKGVIPNVPVILGANADEGSFFMGGWHFLNIDPKKRPEDVRWLREDMINDVLAAHEVRAHRGGSGVEEAIARTFMPDKNRLHFSDLTQDLVNMLGVFAMKGPILKTANILSKRLDSVYFYSLEHQSNNPRNSIYYFLYKIGVPLLGGKVAPYRGGISHGDDMIYTFHLPFLLDDRDKAFSRVMTKLWTNFAASGNPTPEATSEYQVWPKYSWKDEQYYVLRDTPQLGQNYRNQWMQQQL